MKNLSRSGTLTSNWQLQRVILGAPGKSPNPSKRHLILAVDFDGSVVENKFPEIGPTRPHALKVLKLAKAAGHTLILWTCRCGEHLADALEWCTRNGLEFDYINSNDPRLIAYFHGDDPRKINADIYIDDKTVHGPPDWLEIADYLSRPSRWPS